MVVKIRKNHFFIFLVFCVASDVIAQARKNFCSTRSHPQKVTSRCSTREMIPLRKTRNISSHLLTCTIGQYDLNLRNPQEFDFEKWADLLEEPNGPRKALNMRRQQPAIEWEGAIKYKTVEQWIWQSCELRKNSRCGFEYHCYYADDDEMVILDQPDHSASSCKSMMKSCYLDISHYEQLDCSNEVMTYDAVFERPKTRDWNPRSPGYDDSIPNKYDLLVGENENIRVYNSVIGLLSQTSLRLAPQVRIDNARNDYRVSLAFKSSGGQAVACREQSHYHFSATIHTNKRITTRNPLTLSYPVSWDSEKVDPIVWQGDHNEAGEYIEKALPSKILVNEMAAGQVEIISNQSMKSHSNSDFKKEKKEPFLKDTKVRIRLYEKRWWCWDKFINGIYVNGSEAIVPSLNSFSKNQAIQFSDSWEIELDSQDFEKSIYERKVNWPLSYLYGSKGFRQHLRPGRHYALYISIYHSGVGFYKQSCEDDPSQIGCRWWAVGPLGLKESNYYSDELVIDFYADKNYDQRSSWEKIKDTIKIHDHFLNWIKKS